MNRDSDSFQLILNVLGALYGTQAIVIGSIFLIGRFTGNQLLMQLDASFAQMQFNTALGFLICGIGLLLVDLNKKNLLVLGNIIFILAVMKKGLLWAVINQPLLECE